MEKNTKSVKEKIHVRLMEMQNRQIELRKIFKFSVEKLQDEPNACFREIEEYLKEHSDKIEDFWFQNYIDENTFEPVLVMNVVPTPNWRAIMQKNSLFENILPANLRIGIIEKRVREIMDSYRFKMNDKTTRQRMANDIEKAIFKPGKRLKVVDSTTDDIANAGNFSFNVKDGEEEIPLKEYLVKMVSTSAEF